MRKEALLLLVIFAAGCVSFPGSLSAFTLFHSKSFSLVEDVRLSAEVAPDQVLEEKRATVYFDLSNEGNTTIRDAILEITDACAFDAVDQSTMTRDFGDLEPFDRATHEVELVAQPLDLEKACEIRYRASYVSDASLDSDIAIVSEDELTRLNRRGEQSTLKIFETSSKGPVEIDLVVSKPQPIPTDTSFFVYIQLFDRGAGTALPIAVGDIRLSYPTDLVELESCDDLGGDELANAREIKFFQKESKTITCKFHTVSGGVVSETGKFHVDATYVYDLRGGVAVTIKPE